MTAPADATGKVTATAKSGAATEEADVRVLGKLQSLELSSARLSFAEAGASFARTLRVQGRDRQGFTTTVELADLDLSYDESLLKIEQAGDLLRLTPLKPGGTVLSAKVAGEEVKLPITIGVVTQNVYTFDHADETNRWTTNGTAPATQQLSMQDGRLKLTYEGRRNMGITMRTAIVPERIPLPGQPLRMRLRLWSERNITLSYVSYLNADGVSSGPLGSAIKAGWNDLVWTFPASTKFPVRITLVPGDRDQRRRRSRTARSSSTRSRSTARPRSRPPPVPDLRPDPMFSADGKAEGDWSFATLSDIQFTAASPDLAKTGIAALNRIRATNADLVVLNGDITDLGGVADLKLARQTLETGGCDLIRVGAGEDSDPNTIPCYYVPGNHESYTAAGQGTLDNFVAEFGQPYRTFDHKGTRFILLNSTLGNLRSSDFAQLPMLKQALDTAATDDRDRQRDGVRAPPDERSGRARRVAAHRPHRGPADREAPDGLPRGVRQGRRDGRLARADRQRPA